VCLLHLCELGSSVHTALCSESVWDARSRKPLRKAHLAPGYCHVLEAGHDIYVWVRKGCKSKEYKALMEAVEVRKQRQAPIGMLFIEKPHVESFLFRTRFKDWIQFASPLLRLPVKVKAVSPPKAKVGGFPGVCVCVCVCLCVEYECVHQINVFKRKTMCTWE
jgi:hypothetical protein